MLNKLCKVLFFISLFLVALQSYAAAPPPLPPSLPNSTANSTNKEVTSGTESSTSIFDKIKQFFHKSPKKTSLPQPQTQQDKSDDPLNSKLASQEPKENEANEPFIDTGSMTLPSAASNANENNVNLASHSDIKNTTSSQESKENEVTEPFMDTSNTSLPSVANSDLHDNDVAHDSGANLAHNEEVQPELKVAGSLISNPPLRPGSYVVPPAPRVQIYQPISLPATHVPTPLNHPVNTNEQQNNVTAPTQEVAPTPAPTPIVNQPTAPSDMTPTATSVPAVTPSTPNTPVPVINQPTAPNTTPNNTPTPALQPVPSNLNTPAVLSVTTPATTDSSTKTDNSKQTFTAVNSSEKQGWDAPLKPVEVLSVNQNQSSNNISSTPAPINQAQLQSQNTSSSNVVVKKQDNIDNEVTESATKFAKDESQMLLLPNDDIVLGKLTKQATLEQMDIYSYIKLFQKKEEWIANKDKRKAVESLVKYDNDLNKKKDISANLSYCSAINNAFRAVDKNNLSKLRALLDVYPILQEKNSNGDTLLSAATYKDNYYLAKYLVIRGIKISTLNSQCQYPLDIALARGNTNIACMLTKAKGYTR